MAIILVVINTEITFFSQKFTFILHLHKIFYEMYVSFENITIHGIQKKV